MSSPLIPNYYTPPTPTFPVPAYYAPPSPPKPPNNHHHSGSLTGVFIGLFFSFFVLAAGVALFLVCRRRRRRRREDVEEQRETELSSQARSSRPTAVPSSSGPAADPSSSGPAADPSSSGLGPIEEGRRTDEIRPSIARDIRGLSEADIGALPQYFYSPGDLTGHVCGICKKHFVPNNHLLSFEPCHHPVHISCGRSYLRMCRICPTCRVVVLPVRS